MGRCDPVGTGMTLRLIMVPSPFDVQIEEDTTARLLEQKQIYRNISICTYDISKWLIWVVSLLCVLYVCVCYTGKHCLHLAFLHLTPLEHFLHKKWDFKVRLNSWKESMPRRLWSISLHVCGNVCSGSREVNFVLARLRFARFVFSCLVGLEGSVKYSRFLKLKGNFIFFIWCIKVNILNIPERKTQTLASNGCRYICVYVYVCMCICVLVKIGTDTGWFRVRVWHQPPEQH